MMGMLKQRISNWWNIVGDGDVTDEKLIQLKANQLHVFMLGMIFFICLIYSIVGLLLNTPEEAMTTAIPIPVVLILYFGFYRNNLKLVSKIGSVLITLIIVAVLTMINGVPNGELVFMIPIMVGSQIILQGKERKYSYMLITLTLFITLYILITGRRIELPHPFYHSEQQIEYLINYIGATIATIFQVGFLILVNNRLQQRSFAAAHKLRQFNDALASALENNDRQTHQIKSQLEELNKTGLELKKLSLIATMTGNGVVITDTEGKIEWVNKAFEKTTGYSFDEVLGKKPKDFLLRGETDKASQLISEKLSKKEFVGTTVLNYTKDNKPYYNHLEITPIFDENGVHKHFISVQRDTTKEINYLNEIERLKNNYEQVVAEVTNDFIWEWDLISDKIVLGRDLNEIFDPKPGGNGREYIWKLESLHPDDQQKLIEFKDYAINTACEKCLIEYRYLDKKGNYRIFLDKGFIRFDENKKPLNAIGAISDVTEQRRIEAELVEQKFKEQKLIATIALQSQEKEKNKIATELHDNINQLLITSKMYLDLYNSEHNTPDRFLQKSQDGIEKALQEIRKISHSLAAPFSNDYDLIDAIGELISEYETVKPIDARINDKLPKNLEIPEEVKLVIYRIVQEQVQNVYTHSEAKTMDLHFSMNGDSINFTIKDDGKGFEEKALHSGLGLKTINSRVTIHGGAMKLSSKPGQGCQLDISLPLLHKN